MTFCAYFDNNTNKEKNILCTKLITLRLILQVAHFTQGESYRLTSTISNSYLLIDRTVSVTRNRIS
jgi:hypothetical protein